MKAREMKINRTQCSNYTEKDEKVIRNSSEFGILHVGRSIFATSKLKVSVHVCMQGGNLTFNRDDAERRKINSCREYLSVENETDILFCIP
jgi:hypothetical protein